MAGPADRRRARLAATPLHDPSSGASLRVVPKYIAVAGNMGSGKTSLVEFLCAKYDLKPFYEPHEDNPFLERFYGDMPRWAFSSQVHFLTHKLRIHQELERTNGHQAVIQDRTIYEDAEVFATNLHRMGKLNGDEWETYWDLYETVRNSLQPPDVMVYLSCPIRTIRRRIKQRGREMEAQVPYRYLRRLSDLYERWFSHYDLSPVVTVDTGRLDYVQDLVDRLDLFDVLEEILE